MELGTWQEEFSPIRPKEIFYSSNYEDKEFCYLLSDEGVDWQNFCRAKYSNNNWKPFGSPTDFYRSYKVGTGKFVNEKEVLNMEIPVDDNMYFLTNELKKDYKPRQGDIFYYITTKGKIKSGNFKVNNAKHLALLAMKNVFSSSQMAELYTLKIVDKYKKIIKKKVNKV